jgi:hypothetical protein
MSAADTLDAGCRHCGNLVIHDIGCVYKGKVTFGDCYPTARPPRGAPEPFRSIPPDDTHKRTRDHARCDNIAKFAAALKALGADPARCQKLWKLYHAH